MWRAMDEKECEPAPRSGSIDVESPEELRRWARIFAVTVPVLQQAVRIVGTSVAELRKLFCRD
jgi:hypothetical protein